MKIAIISDLHGNIDALDAVTQVFEKYDINKVFVLGDIVGYYYYPEKILASLEKYDCYFIRGNHEIIFQKILLGELSIEEVTEKYGSGHAFAVKNLTNKQIDFLINLPDELKINLDGKQVLLRHANPWNLTDYLYPTNTEEALKRSVEGAYDFVLVGHSHYAFDFRYDNKTLINPGSVGQNRKKGGLASWVLLDTSNFTYKFMLDSYNADNLINMIENTDPQNDYLKKILLR